MKHGKLFFIIALAAMTAGQAWGQTYYVDQTGGLDNNAGTSTGAPWATISKVNASSFSAGDSILFKKGETWREQLTVPSSGSAGSPITFGAYGSGAAPILNGSDLITSWSAVAAGGTNLNANPEAFGAWPANKMTVDNNVATPLSPIGTQTVESLSPLDNTSEEHLLHVDGGGFAPATAYTLSVYVKPNFSNWFELQMRFYNSGWGSISGVSAYFDIATGVVGTTAGSPSTSITPVDNGWYRISISKTSPALTANIVYQVELANADNGGTFAGDSTKIYSYAWGGKFEAASAPTLYSNVNLYSAAFSATTPHIVHLDNNAGTPKTATSALVADGDWYWASNVAYLKSATDPAGRVIEIGDRADGVLVDTHDYVAISGLTVTKANTDGVMLDNVNNVIVDQITATKNYRSGVTNRGDATDNTSNVTVQDGTYSYNGLSGIEFHGGGGSAGQYHDVTVQRNSVHHNGWSTQGPSTSNIKFWGGYPGTSLAYNATIQNNDVYSAVSATLGTQLGTAIGIWIDEFGTGAVVRRNQIHDNGGYGIELEHHSGSEAYYNVLWNNGTDTVDGNPNAPHGDINVWRSASNMLVYNNTCYGSPVGITVRGYSTDTTMVGNLIKNNACVGTVESFRATLGGENAGNGSGNVYEYNAFGPEASNFIEWGNGVYKSTYAAFDNAYGSATHSVTADPLFVSTATPDFRLQAGSPAKGAGVDVGLTLDYAGRAVKNPPSIGAYEFYGGGCSGFPCFPSFPSFPSWQ